MAKKYNNYTVSQIVDRYSNAIHDLAEVQKAINVGDEVRKEKGLSDAGEALSQTIEWALHNHIRKKNEKYFSDVVKPSTPTMIKDNYLDGTFARALYADTISNESPTVDFAFLRENKDPLTNSKKHKALRLDYDVQKRYAIEIAKFIKEYVDNQVQLITVEELLAPEQNLQLSFYLSCNSFSHQDCLYILLLDNQPMASSNYNYLSRANWDLVIDMYMGSMDNGFVKNALAANSLPYKVISINDRLSDDTFPLYNGEVPVIMANGFTGKAVNYHTARDWARHNSSKLTSFLQTFFSVHTEQKVVVVSMLKNVEFVRHLFTSIDSTARGLSFIITNDKEKQMVSLPEQIADCIICSGLMPEEANQCIGRFLPQKNASKSASYLIPAKEGMCTLSAVEMRSYEENLEILYDGIDEGFDESEEDYLNGSTILTWEGAHRKFAVTRTKHYGQYVSKIEKALMRGARKAMIIHEPGFGGTTLARQIAYDLHDKFPTIIIKQYKSNSLKTHLERIYDCTNKSLLVIVEIPQVLTIDEFERLKGQLSSTRPILLLGVKRGTLSKEKDILELPVPDWGNDVCLLIDKFKPYLKRYSPIVQKKKENEFLQIANGPSEPYQRTPFYIGLLTFEEEFYAIDSYLRKFVSSIVGNESQRKVLVYLALCDYYGIKRTIPEGFFASVFDEVDEKGLFRLEERFSKAEGVVKSLLTYEKNNGAKQWQIRNPFFSHKLLVMLLNGINSTDTTKKFMNLGRYCKCFIEDIARSEYREMLEESVLQQLLIGTKSDRNGEKFTEIVRDMSSSEQEDVLNTLHKTFPENAHFCSHLARYYSSVKKDFARALELADLAISLSSVEDAMLYHIKAMCFSHEIGKIIDDYRNQHLKNHEKGRESLQNIIDNLLPQASENFELARKYQHDDDKEITYLPNIYMLIKLFDYAIDVHDLDRMKVLSEVMCPYCEWIDEAQSLLDSLKQSYLNEETEEYTQCETKMWDSIKDFSIVIELLNNQLSKGRNVSLIRRLIVRAYFNKNDKYKSNKKINSHLMSLMEDNIAAAPSDERNYILWFNAARYSDLALEAILSKMNQWKGLNPTKDIIFYCFVFTAIKALQNDTTASVVASRLLEQCKHAGGFDSVHIKEWYVGTKLGIKKYSELTSDKEERKRVYGRVNSYKHAGDAHIVLDCGLDVFFKPAVSGIIEANLNHKVSCLIGFSYDGIRALDESVELEE